MSYYNLLISATVMPQAPYILVTFKATVDPALRSRILAWQSVYIYLLVDTNY